MGHAKKEAEWVIVDRLADVILNNVEGCIVDIGMGLSTVILSRYAIMFNRKQYSCDIDKWCAKKLSNLHPNHKVFIGSSENFLKEFNDTPALVFIDDSHQYSNVKREMDFFLDRIAYQGIIFLHDTIPISEEFISSEGGKCGEAYRIRQELEKRSDLWTFTWAYPKQAQNCGLTMITKKDLNRPFYQI